MKFSKLSICNLVYIIGISLFIINILLVIKNRTLNANQIANRESSYSRLDLNSKTFNEYLVANKIYQGTIQNIKVYNLNGKEYYLKQLIREEKNLVVRIDELHCSECCHFILHKLKKMPYDIIKNEVLILATFQNKRTIKSLCTDIIEDENVYLIDRGINNVDSLNFPYLFHLNKDLQMTDIFIPNKAFPRSLDYYLDYCLK